MDPVTTRDRRSRPGSSKSMTRAAATSRWAAAQPLSPFRSVTKVEAPWRPLRGVAQDEVTAAARAVKGPPALPRSLPATKKAARSPPAP